MLAEIVMIGWISLSGRNYIHLEFDLLLIFCSLPFYSEDSCALGIVIKTYLDELCTREDSVSEQTRAEMKMKGQGWVDYADFNGSLEDAFVLWDAASN